MRRRAGASFVPMLAVIPLLLLTSRVSADELPHVRQCSYCHACFVGEQPPRDDDAWMALNAAADAAGQPQQQSDGAVPTGTNTVSSVQSRALQQEPETGDELALSAEMFRADAADVLAKQLLPICPRCYGCNTELTHMSSESQFFNTTYINEKGASANWLFRASTPGTPGGQAVVKVYCVPVPKRVGGRIPTCSPVPVLRTMRLQRALNKLAGECGFTDILPKTWVAPVNGIIPGNGFHIRWHALWMELIQGVSVENLLHRGLPHRLAPEQVLDLLHNKLNKSHVIKAAIFDLLTSQCDRHSQNIFIDEAGHVHLIDNDVALQNSWRNCAVDSIFVPGTQKQEIIRLSNQFVLKHVSVAHAPQGEADPQLLLDYRCYLGPDRDELGTDYPPQIAQCLRNIAGMTVMEVEKHYGLDELPARNLLTRAKDMITQGYEWTMKYGEPRSAPPKRYLIQPKCCRIEWRDRAYRCAHDYKPIYELPIGDPVTGREWTKPRRDTGTFEGGARYT